VPDFLDEMAGSSAARARTLAGRSGELLAAAERTELPLPLVSSDFGVIAEIKPRAPSAGHLGAVDIGACAQRARAYATGGAACVSVLTEPSRFDGSLDHLAAIARVLRAHDVPAMRKDFLVDPLQIAEARIAGASGVLLIARMLDDVRLGEMIHAAQSLGLFAIVEAFDEVDLARSAHAIASSPARLLVGVNCRDLTTLQIDRARLLSLAQYLPTGVDAVAESGLETEDDVGAVVRAGYRAALIGTSLMRALDPTARVRALTDAGLRVAREAS